MYSPRRAARVIRASDAHGEPCAPVRLCARVRRIKNAPLIIVERVAGCVSVRRVRERAAERFSRAAVCLAAVARDARVVGASRARQQRSTTCGPFERSPATQPLPALPGPVSPRPRRLDLRRLDLPRPRGHTPLRVCMCVYVCLRVFARVVSPLVSPVDPHATQSLLVSPILQSRAESARLSHAPYVLRARRARSRLSSPIMIEGLEAFA